MSQRFLLGLDFGGGGGRCLVADLDSGRITRATRAWSFPSDPANPAAAEIDVGLAWRRLAEATREALQRAGARANEVAGIAATSMRHASVVVDADGEVLLAASNRDARGLAKILELAGAHGEELHRRTGHWPNPVQPAGRLCWLASERPADLERAAAHLAISDWIGYRLCGEIAAEPSQAGETLLLDLASRSWAEDWIEKLGLPRALFPELRDAGTRLGGLLDAPAAELGLRPGIPVAVGGGDTQCGLLGAGAVAEGQLAAVAGTTAPLQRVFSRPVMDDEARLWAAPHVVPGEWTLESNAGGMGEALEWIAGALYAESSHPVLHLLDDAARSEPGAAGIVSNVGAEVMNARALGLPIGNLTLSQLAAAGDPDRRRHLARAVIEGMACALRANAEQIESAAGVDATLLRLAGGLSRSPLLAQLTSDVLDRSVEVAATPETSALGAAICAGVGAGLFADLAEGAGRLASVARRHEPDPACRSFYADHYAAWQNLREARAASDAAASGMVMRGLLGSGAGAARSQASEFRPKILVAADLDEAGLDALRAIGDVEYASFRKAMRLLTGPSLVEALEGVHVFVTEIDVVDAESLVKSKDLRLIAVCRGDAVNVDLEAATALGIPVVNTPGRNADAVADLTVAFMLMLARKLPEANAFLREPGGEAGDMGRMGRAFGQLQGRELWRKTVGLVGLGAVGRKVLARLRPFGVRCLVCDPYLEPDAVRLAGAEPASLQELLEHSDFVSLHAAVTDETRGLIGEAELARMRPEACLINTARAALVDEDALVSALESGGLAGAALDVFAVEPPASDHPLLALPQVIATPHVGGNTADVAAHQGQIVAEELERIRRGERPRHLLNPETWEGYSLGDSRPEASAEVAAQLTQRGRGGGPAVTDLQKDEEAPKPARAERSSAAAPAAATRSEGGDVSESRTAMENILRAFVQRIVADEALLEFAKSGQEVALHFRLSDLGSEFHFGFRDGAVYGDVGPPDSTAGVELKMKADLLDGMFTGRSNAMQAAMDGQLSFSGDTAKAMTLTHIQSDLNRLYRAARNEVGDPGDLASIPDPTGAAAEAAPAKAPAAGSDTLREHLVEVVNELYTTQLITATGGNVSARIPDAPDTAWITPSQLFKGDLSAQILVRIDSRGKALDEDARSPSSEALMHTAVLAAKPEAQAVIHCHPPNATILANAGLPFLPISTEAAFLVNIGRIPFVMPGTQDLADAIVEAMGNGWAVLMQNHGLLVAGRSLRRAADMCEIIERTAEVIIGCRSVGMDPPLLPEETVEMLSKYGDLMA